MHRTAGRFALVLHTHLPYVLRHGRWPHGTDWLCEAVAESYLPILESFRRLEADGVPSRATIALSPVLCEQLADEAFPAEFRRWISARREQVALDEKQERAKGHPVPEPLLRHWREWIDSVEQRFDAIDGNVIGAFRGLEERGRVELATCAATHGYLPLLSTDESIELQLRTAVASHRRHFGRAPRALWLPECAYRPRYEWTPPLGPEQGKRRWPRPGIEELLSENSIEITVVDSHLVHAGEPLSIYRNLYPALASLRGFEERFPQHSRMRSCHTVYSARSRGIDRGVDVLVRDARTALQVWSQKDGYPGDPLYLDFHQRPIANGLRYHRVTDAQDREAAKEHWDPVAARARTEEHARHFVWLVKSTLEKSSVTEGSGPILCAPYDTELFGHFWFEGAEFLEHVFRHLANAHVTAVSASEAGAAPGPRESLTLLEGSWGEGGDHRAWLNSASEWSWNRVYDAEKDAVDVTRAVAAANGFPPERRDLGDRALRQALRELLLLQSSDWQFLMTTGAARDYAERRFATHYVELKRLADFTRRCLSGSAPDPQDEEYLSVLEKRDRAFPDIDVQAFSLPR